MGVVGRLDFLLFCKVYGLLGEIMLGGGVGSVRSLYMQIDHLIMLHSHYTQIYTSNSPKAENTTHTCLTPEFPPK